MFCKNCGTQFQDGARFCRKCGMRVEQQAATNIMPCGTMSEIRQQMKKKAKESLIALIIILAVGLSGVAVSFIGAESEIGPFLLLVGIILLFTWWPMHYMCFASYRNMRWLKKREKEYVGDDIVLRGGVRLCCGRDAFFETKQKLLIPYSEVIWAYPYSVRYLLIPLLKSIVVWTRDGKMYHLKVSAEEFTQMYQQNAQKFPQEFMVGYTKENTKAYQKIKKAYRNQTR